MINILKTQFVLLLTTWLFCSGVSFASVDTINRLDNHGERFGYWVLDSNNKPTSLVSKTKLKEGVYVKGRKQGAWILYFEDGVTPRLIGEYHDNRPKGAFFRFDKQGEITQAGVVSKEQNLPYAVNRKSELFACRMLLSNYDVVAGQVFFEKSVFNKPYEYQFWLEDKVYDNKIAYENVDFSWLNQNFTSLFANYLEVRSPKLIEIHTNSLHQSGQDIIEEQAEKSAKTFEKKRDLPPFVNNPKVAKGMVFQRNGFNKLYTSTNEIWMDGLFRDGQLFSGKVFEYDKDGVLFRVRVYQDGEYIKDGMI